MIKNREGGDTLTDEQNTNGINAKKTKERKKSIRGIAAFSLLISLLDRLGDIIYDAIINGFFGKIFTSYTKLRERALNGFLGHIFAKNGKFKRFFRRIRKFLAENIDSSFSMSFTSSVISPLKIVI